MSGTNKSKIAVLDDWQGVARGAADWSMLDARADVTVFQEAFADENDAVAKLADFDIVLSMRERTPLPATLINRLPKLRMMGMTGARNASLDTPACTARGSPVGATSGGALVYGSGFTAEPAGDHPVWHKSEPDVRPGQHDEHTPCPGFSSSSTSRVRARGWTTSPASTYATAPSLGW